MANHQRIARDVQLLAETRALRRRKRLHVDSGRNHRDRRGDAAAPNHPRDALARCDDAVAEVGVVGRDLDRDLAQRFGKGHVVRVILVAGVVREEDRHVLVHRHAQRGVAEQDGMMRVDDVRLERLDPRR